MKNKTVNKMVVQAKRKCHKNGPKMMVCVGIAGMIGAGCWAVAETPKVMKLIAEEKQRKLKEIESECVTETEVIAEPKLTAVETIKAAWKPYAPAVVLCALSATCIIKGNSMAMKQTAAFATAYELTKRAYTDYKDAVIETIGKEKEKEVTEKVAEKRVANTPNDNNTVIVMGSGDYLYLDSISGRYFKSDANKLQKAENEINFILRNENYVSLNHLYDMLGLNHTSIGDDLGWNIDCDGYLRFDLSAQMTEHGEPCIYVDYSVAPKYEYDRFY